MLWIRLQVLNELAGDKSLERFRIEYDKLYRTLKKSHGATLCMRRAWCLLRAAEDRAAGHPATMPQKAGGPAAAAEL
jgi:hypothetical protein